jgi:phasin family protein
MVSEQFKLLEQKMPRFNFDDMFAAQRATIQALVSVGNTALASAERVAALNLHAVREAMVDFAEGTQRMLMVKSPRDAAELQNQLTQPQVEKSVLYSRSLVEISSAAQEDAVHLIEAQYNNFMGSMSELANQIAKSTPMGSEVAVAAIRSTMQSANEAFDRFNDAVVRFTEVTEDSVSTMGNATVSAATGKAVPKRPTRRK